ncbi:MAG: arginine--tRNA ligase [Phycisphaeraceae bacterium]|nr:arginine--tRNA ligase [Phycisphaeraceae bacterium]
MQDPTTQLSIAFSKAIVAAFGEEYAAIDPLIKPSGNPKFGDYQANVAMSLAKRVGDNPRNVAAKIVDAIDTGDWGEKLEIAGPGFINVHLKTDYLISQLAAVATDEHLGVDQASGGKVVVDYSGPNVAKEMHVGHLRSTVIGDAIARVLAFEGYNVIRQNHLGDWGTQFGMLIENLIDAGAGADTHISDLKTFYQDAKKRFDDEPEFKDRARKRVVALQGGDEKTLELWGKLIDESKRHFNHAYQLLGVLLTDDDIRAESFYNDKLPEVITALEDAGKLKESQGAKVVYPEGFKDEEGNPFPMIVCKSDGGFLYATTDLAALRYRMNDLKADRIVYVTDSRQSQHFAMVFQTVNQCHWRPDNVQLDHVAFGTVLGPDRKPFKTRSGDTVKLIDLMEEAVNRAAGVIAEKTSDLSEDDQKNVARVVGIGALKYADLSSDRIKDYVFDWDRMLALEGNTAPYLINAYVRIQSIFRKGEIDVATVDASKIQLGEDAEKTLALKLLQFGSAVQSVASSLEPHRLCTYLYELASGFHSFYEKCPVLKDGVEPDIKDSRLALSALVARTLKEGLNLLGIDVVDRM